MRRLFALILVFCMWLGFSLMSPAAAWADLSFDTLTPCGQSSAFQQRQESEISGYQARLSKFEPGSAPAKYLESKVASTKARFAKYANSSLLCGEDGLPHLISDGRLSHASEFLIPSVLFLYIAGWIGWAGRSYLRSIKKDPDTALEKEILIDVPVAFAFMLAAAAWPLIALKELGTGELIAPEKEVPVSPR